MILTAVLKLFTGLVILLFSSIFFYLSFQSFYIPKNVLFREPIYFDFSKDIPTAKITLASEEKQWEYSGSHEYEAKSKRRYRFMKSGISYVVSMEMQLSRSNRNKVLSKFMVTAKASDIMGAEIAVSTRPIIIPYRSTVSRVLEDALFWPFRLVGVFRHGEANYVREDLMNNYKERVEPTDRFEFNLSTNAADVEGVTLSILPRLNLLT